MQRDTKDALMGMLLLAVVSSAATLLLISIDSTAYYLFSYDIDWFNTMSGIVVTVVILVGLITIKDILKAKAKEHLANFKNNIILIAAQKAIQYKERETIAACRGEHDIVIKLGDIAYFYCCNKCKANTANGTLKISYKAMQRLLSKVDHAG